MWHEIAMALIAAIVSDVVLGWSNRLSRWLVCRSAQSTPPELADRLEEEWLGEWQHRPDKLSRLVFSIDIFRAAFVLTNDHYLPETSFWTLLILRAIDLLSALCFWIFVLPMSGLCWIAVKLEDGWSAPAFIRETVVGRGGRPFQLLRFRCTALSDESSLTKVGRFLYRTRLNEIPQVLNILRGEMSLVGPRPEPPEFVAHMLLHVPIYAQRHRVRPGLTGWEQLCQPRRPLDEFEGCRSLSRDLYYIDNMLTIADNLSILMWTVREVLWPWRGIPVGNRTTKGQPVTPSTTYEEIGLSSRVETELQRLLKARDSMAE